MRQLKEKVDLHYENFSFGGKKIIWGLFKKVVIADNLSPIVDSVYASPENFSWTWLLLATYFFAIQIYCDFSGYSDMAIGVARCMGVKLMVNFNLPYLSRSIREFWSRWHISLSSWFRDYLYKPLGGNRLGERRTRLNLLLVFFISGLWHGAAWTFIVWGFLHGLYLIVELFLAKQPWWKRYATGAPSWHTWLGIFILFHLVCFGWIFFRAETLQGALLIVKNIFTLHTSGAALPDFIQWMGLPGLAIKLVLFFFLLLTDAFFNRFSSGEMQGTIAHRYRMFVFASLVAAIGFIGNWGEVQFIYFQF
jgi:D-alanyl-lipoteichoic acid acyltransferase DltB (MBOAT superfamily)